MSLNERFKKNGFTYHLVKRNESCAIYTQKKEGFSYEYFEVIKIQTVKKDVDTSFMTLKAGTEFYPSSNEWGSKGWTFKTLEQAEKKFDELSTFRCLQCNHVLPRYFHHENA
jgi:hypothetical protein